MFVGFVFLFRAILKTNERFALLMLYHAVHQL